MNWVDIAELRASLITCSGFARSVGGLGIINASAALLMSASQSPRGLGDQVHTAKHTSARLLVASSALSDALSDASVVLAAIQTTWGGVNVSEVSSAPFSLTLSSATPIVLRSSRRSFSTETSITVGGIRCNSTAVSENGEWLAAIAPGPADVCAAAGRSNAQTGDCSYATLTTENPSSFDRRGARLSCPPFCSGVLSLRSGVIPLPVRTDDALHSTYTPAFALPGGTLQALSALDFGVASGTAYPPGLYFSAACSSSGIFTDPSSGACTNLSSPLFQFCAFGSGDSCEPCPAGGMCPGGHRCWSLPGFYTASETSGTVLSCAQPDAPSKCVGWNAALASTQCGPGYMQVCKMRPSSTSSHFPHVLRRHKCLVPSRRGRISAERAPVTSFWPTTERVTPAP